MQENEINEVVEGYKVQQGEEAVGDAIHYGGLLELLAECDGSQEAIKDCWFYALQCV